MPGRSNSRTSTTRKGLRCRKEAMPNGMDAIGPGHSGSVLVAEAVTVRTRPGVLTSREYKIITGRALRVVPQQCPRCGADPELWGTSSVRCSGRHCHLWGPACKSLSESITEWNRIRYE